MKICKKIVIIFLISIVLLYSIIPSKTVFAEDSEKLSSADEAGQIIADFARDMVANHSEETIYDYGNSWTSLKIAGTNQDNPYYNNTINYGRLQAYKGNKVTGYAQASPAGGGTWVFAENKFFMDCVGFVSFCIHHSLGLTGNEGGNFVVPGAIRKTDYFVDVTGSTLKPGDIIYSSGHVMIYLGNNTLAESSDISNPGWHIKFRSSFPTSYQVARIKDTAAKQIPRSQTKSSWDGTGTTGGSVIVVPEVDDSAQFNIYIGTGNLDGLGNSNKFYYNGVPRNGEYLGKTEEDNWLFDALENAADWLLGIITMNIKIQAIGWTNIFEKVANSIVEEMSNEDLENRITVEDVIYNKVKVLDVNFFNLTPPEGEGSSSNIVYALRQKVANGYVFMRTLCIVLMLFTLIYIGIRTAISTVAKDKAEYKQKLIGWVVGFIIVMFIHYFMIVVLSLNEVGVNMVAPDGSTATVYEQVRTYAYEIPATKGWTGTILYVFLVYFLIKMLVFYFKRLLIVYILAIVSPAVGVAYSIEKIKGKTKSLGVWMKEFAFNVLIQFIHAVIYTVMMSIILTFTATAQIKDIIPYAIILLVLINFLLEVEDIIKNIFKIQSNSLKSVLSTALDIGGRLAPGIAIAKFAYGKGKKAVINTYDKNLTNSLNTKYDKYKVQGDSEVAQSVNKEIERLKAQEKAHIKELDSEAIEFAKSKLSGTVALVTGVPALFEKPILGASALGYTATELATPFAPNRKNGKAAEQLEANTEGTEYVYIDNPEYYLEDDMPDFYIPNNSVDDITIVDSSRSNTNGRGNNGNTSGNKQSSTYKNRTTNHNNENNNSNEGIDDYENDTRIQERYSSENEEEQRTIRTYNTDKKKKYTLPKMALSWATLRESKNIGVVINRNKIIRGDAFEKGFSEQELIERVYKTRIEKLSIIGSIAVKQVDNINKELDKIQANNYPPIYYTPKQGENKTQVAMNEKLREKYREILRKNIEQIYKGVDRNKVNEHIGNYKGEKVTLKSVEEIAKEYLSENECNIGDEFKDNLNDLLIEKIKNTAQSNSNGFEKVKLNPEIEEKIRSIVKENSNDEEKLKKELDKAITEDVKEQVVTKITTKDLTELISKTLEQKGSIQINKDFEKIQEPVETLRLANQEAKVTAGNEIYTTEQLINLIMNKNITE